MNETGWQDWLRQKMRDAGKTQAALAADIGVTQQQISGYLGGEIPSAKYVGPIARALGVSMFEVGQAVSATDLMPPAEGPEDREEQLRRWRAIEEEAREQIRRLEA